MVETTGDRRPDVPIWELGGQGVFVKEVQAAVLDGRADIAVHSAKDLPSTPPEAWSSPPSRSEATPATPSSAPRSTRCPSGAGSAPARCAGGPSWRGCAPDLTFAGLRGNIETRLAKAAGFDAIVVAAAALRPAGRAPERSTEVLDPELMVPQVGQGALAVECRADDDAHARVLARHRRTVRPAPAVDAERACLREVGAGATCRWAPTPPSVPTATGRRRSA